MVTTTLPMLVSLLNASRRVQEATGWDSTHLLAVLDGSRLMSDREMQQIADELGVTKQSLTEGRHDWLSDCASGPIIVSSFVLNNFPRPLDFSDEYHRVADMWSRNRDDIPPSGPNFSRWMLLRMVYDRFPMPADFVDVCAALTGVPPDVIRWADTRILSDFRGTRNFSA